MNEIIVTYGKMHLFAGSKYFSLSFNLVAINEYKISFSFETV